MSRFNQVLKETDGRLAVSEPARSRILLEIAADMEGLHREFLERGLSPEDAQEEVLEHFDLSDEALRELIRVHDSPLERSLGTLSDQVESPWSRILLLVLALFVVAGSGSLLFWTRLYRDASSLVWVVVPVLGFGAVLAGRRAYRLFRRDSGWSKERRGDGGAILGLSLLVPVFAGVGLWVELYRGMLRIRTAPRDALIYLVDWLHMASATLTVALSGGLVLGFLWFFLDSRARRLEREAADNLLRGIS